MEKRIFNHGYTALLLWAVLVAAPSTGSSESAAGGDFLNLPVFEIRFTFQPYADFCRRNPGECDMSGDCEIQHTKRLVDRLVQVNAAVNREILFASDKAQYGAEEYWSYPSTGWGDCEDMALEKRRRLVLSGMPRGALRMAIGHHRRFLHSHCLLSVETSRGTYILDTLTDEVLLWRLTPYDFESRERTDGRWDRYDQGMWLKRP
jgi:predicted transglutaminase-like cysteine proteinase